MSEINIYHSWWDVCDKLPEPEIDVDIADIKNETTGVGYVDACGNWVVAYGNIEKVDMWKMRVSPFYKFKPPTCVGYDPRSELGEREPYVVYFRRDDGSNIPFHITPYALTQIEGGEGDIYGRTPWGPWCRLHVYRYFVVSYRIVDDINELEAILSAMEE